MRKVLSVLSAGLLTAGAFTCSSAEAKPKANPCEDEVGLAVLVSPFAPSRQAPLRVLFATEKALYGEFTLVSPKGTVAAKSSTRNGGPPYFWHAEVKSPTPGKWQAKLTRNGATTECSELTRTVVVRKKRGVAPGARKGSVWPIRDKWTRENENLYSAWIEKLFDAPVEESLSWRALHEGLRDRNRNFLFNHLGRREDQRGHIIRPDCADLPYFLRTYFSFKMGLPFGYTKCTRGGGGKPPKCYRWWNIKKEEPPPEPPESKKTEPGFLTLFGSPPPKPKPKRVSKRPKDLVQGFGYYIQTTVANSVHSGNGRTTAEDNNTDYYPVPLTRESLRPGTVYIDPYGHLLVISKRVPQTDNSAGVFLAVDGQPDGTIARKRFWRGNFLFAKDPALGSPGFKRFRPIFSAKGGGLRRLTNAEIAKHPDYSDYSLQQSKLSIEDFYDRMDDVMSPEPLDPIRAMKEAIVSLDEQVNARVTSVENGRKFHRKNKSVVAIPDGAAIFETTGPWEDFATPARDLRLLIAIDVVRKFPERIARRPDRYAMPAGKTADTVKAELESVLATELSAREFTYKRTDGSDWKLTLKDVLDRITKLEMAYNINDCVEHRWGAPEGSDEAATCKRRAPDTQRVRMAKYRPWFSERRRPPR